MDGIELAIRFSYIVNLLRYCGPQEAHKEFVKYLKNKENEANVEKLLDKFEGLKPYLTSIAEKNGKKMLDYDVVESYWIGNSLLDNFEKEDMKEIVNKLVLRGLPKSIGDSLNEKMPAGFVPQHSFNVIYVGVGKATGSVPTNIENMNNCMISTGKVVEIKEDELIVRVSPLEEKERKISFGPEIGKTVKYMKEMIPDVKVNDYVGVHWNFAAIVLNDKQVDNLKKYTRQVLDVVNSI